MKYYTSEEAATIITDDLPLPNYADTDDESSESDDDDVETFRIPSPLDEMEELVLPEQIVDDTTDFLVETNITFNDSDIPS